MKTIDKAAALCALGLVLSGCADTTIDQLQVDKPASIAAYEYLDAYGPLKSYLDRSAHPGFLLGTGVSAQAFNQKGLVYRVTASNYDMLTTGNAMKYASIVRDDGSMDFSTVEDFIDNATAAGLQVYGHTLCWHAQQNVKWLNSLIADRELDIDPNEKVEVEDAFKNYQGLDKFPFYVMGYEPEIIDGILTVPVYPEGWYQFFVMDGLTFVEGREYKVTARIKGSKPGRLNVQLGNWGALQEKGLEFTDEWDEVSIMMNPQTVTTGFCVFQPGTYDGKLEIEWVKVTHSEAPVMKIYTSIISGGDADNGESESIIAREPGQADYPAHVVDDPLGTGKVYASPYNADPVNAWDSQFFIKFDRSLQPEDRIRVSFRYRVSDARNIDTQAHGAPGSYHHWSFIGTLNATTEWKEHSWIGSITTDHAGGDGCQSIAFNIASAPTAGTFYIDDVVVEIEKSANSLELTPEEKAEVLENEMERWVKACMEKTAGRVKAWDVVNEAISGGPWGQKYDLQHGSADTPNDFFWQDYLGDNFVRVPVKYARQYFEEFGGNPDELKLFVNDYNLESDWDDNQKLKSLIQWIEQWESDGVTKIDGIGSQMHVSYHMNPQTQKSKEEHIVKMYQLLAASGKLVRITELDMGICDEQGNSIKTPDVTFEQQKLMAEYYRFIIEKYFEIIPVAQQFGICQWAQTDSPESSGWRGGEPIGIYTEDYQRKPQYEGWVRGIKEDKTPITVSE